MRLFMAGLMLGGSLSLGGCAHMEPVDTPLTPQAVVSYRSVRSGEQAVSTADGVQLCAADGAVEAISKRYRSYDDWADKFRDRDVQEEVRDLIRRDPTLAQQSLNVRVEGGEAIIGGTVQHDADAVAAARDALAVPGVVAVQLQTESIESPTHARLVATSCD